MKYDIELRIFSKGYDVGQHTKKAGKTGRSTVYCIHATDTKKEDTPNEV